jgi:hypothetical protein
MKKILIAALLASLAAATQVSALTVTVTTVPGYNGGSGGEFNVTPITGTGYAPTVLVGGGFETFCLSRNVGIIIPGTYNATVNASGVYDYDYTSTKTMAVGTAYLYSQFAGGGLAGYNYTPGAGRQASADMLQLAIWTLEGQYSYGSLAADLANPFLTLAANLYGGNTAGLLLAMASGAGFNVGALNLTFASNVVLPGGAVIPAGTKAQPLLTLLPDGGTTLMLMGIGFSSLALISRKFRA